MRCEAHDSHADDDRDSAAGGFSEFDEDVSFEDTYGDDEESDDDEDADDEDEADEEEEGDEDLAYFLGEDEDENY